MDRDPTPAAPHGSEPVVSVRGLTKRFGPVVACDAIDLDLRAGEVHGILGENGAGKTTLLRLIAGVEAPDAGTLRFDGARTGSSRNGGRRRPEIGMVHQHYSLVGALTVWENVTLGMRGRLEPERVRARIQEIADRYGIPVEPDALVSDLDVSARQRVEIVKCLVRGPRVLLLDEPGASLAPRDSEALLAVLREGARRDGWAVALVSHRIDEVLAVADTISVLRAGAVAARADASHADAATLAAAMTGRRDVPVVRPRSNRPETGPPVLRVESARLVEPDGRVALDGLSLQVGGGEVVGVAGVDGNGQLALSRVLSSLVRLDAGTVWAGEETVPTGIPGALQRAGVAVIPADRHESGCVPDMTVAENLLLGALETVSSRRGLLDRSAMTRRATRLMEDFDIRAPGPDTPLRHLSGGNQQRVVLARALAGSPRVVVAHQPTRGLDPEAVVAVRRRLRDAALAGAGVLLISADLDELEELADRILVVVRGRIVGDVAGPVFDRDRIGRLMAGTGEP